MQAMHMCGTALQLDHAESTLARQCVGIVVHGHCSVCWQASPYFAAGFQYQAQLERYLLLYMSRTQQHKCLIRGA